MNKVIQTEKRRDRGVAAVEFAFCVLTLIPILMGSLGIGVNLVRTLQVSQLALDAGHLFASGLTVYQPGNQVILANIGSPLGLSTTPGSGNTVLIFTALTYVDTAACAEVGAVDGSGNPSGCTNYGQWVFAQRIVMGNSSMFSSSFGTPITTGANGITPDPTTGMITPYQYVLLSGAVATFNNMINPYSDVNGNVAGLPSGQFLYVTEAVTDAFVLPPYYTNSTLYAYDIS